MIRAMKIAVLGQYPLERSRPDGGVEAVISVLCQEMARRPGIDFRVFTCARTGKTRPPGLENGFITEWLPRKRLGRATSYWRDSREIRRHLRRFRPDVVHAHGTGLYATAALWAGCPATVITPHGIVAREAKLTMPLQERIGWWLQAVWEARVLRRARHIISISPYLERELAGRTRAMFHPIENPVDDAYFTVGDPRASGCILWTGRIIPRKDPQTAIRAFARVKSAYPRARLRMVGELSSCPAYARATLQLAANLGLSDSVQFLGQVDQETLIHEYEAAQCVLVTSVQETAPVVIAEAMAGGRPVVSTDAGGCGHLVSSGRTGLLAPKGAEGILAEHIGSLLESPDLTLRLSQAAREEARARFRASLAVDRTLELYRDLVSLRPNAETLNRPSSGRSPRSCP
jgi:glycosyltransferase involved in cell wall biosynthesis